MRDFKKDPYEDMLDLPHPVSRVHPQMPLKDRAAQFAPFAALTGHGDAIAEQARLTDARPQLDETMQADLDGKMQLIRESLHRQPVVTVTYFVPDERKSGGSIHQVSGTVKRILMYEHQLVLTDGTQIPIDDILGIEGALFRFMEG
jgi:hypothetical protein